MLPESSILGKTPMSGMCWNEDITDLYEAHQHITADLSIYQSVPNTDSRMLFRSKFHSVESFSSS